MENQTTKQVNSLITEVYKNDDKRYKEIEKIENKIKMKNQEIYIKIKKLVKQLTDENKDFTDLNNEFKECLDDLSNDREKLVSKCRKLLNILLKYPKRKILFEYTEKAEKNTYYGDRTYKIGLNTSGLGIIDYGTNMKNVGNYYTRDTFIRLLQNKDFLNEFLKVVNKHLKGKYKKLIKDLVNYLINLDDNGFRKEEINFKDIEINIGSYGYGLSYRINSEKNNKRSGSISIIKNDNDEDNEPNLNFNLTDLDNYCYFLQYKDEIIKILKEKFEKFKSKHKEVKIKLDKINKYLMPYEALERI